MAAKNDFKGKDLNWLENKLQTIVNNKVRKRDCFKGFFVCISCDELKPEKQCNAGHYYPKEPKQYRSVKFDLDNIHAQCVRCNHYLSGNPIPYRANLLKKIGQSRMDQLDQKAGLKNFKYTRSFLIELINKYSTT